MKDETLHNTNDNNYNNDNDNNNNNTNCYYYDNDNDGDHENDIDYDDDDNDNDNNRWMWNGRVLLHDYRIPWTISESHRYFNLKIYVWGSFVSVVLDFNNITVQNRNNV